MTQKVTLRREFRMWESFHEGLWLEDWAADCAQDHVWDAFYIAAPLRIVTGTAPR